MAIHVEIQLDPAVLARAITDLGLRNPPSFRVNAGQDPKYIKATRATKGKVAYQHNGRYSPADNRVDIVSTHATARTAPLSYVTKRIAFTVLHELRHAWQRQEWDEERMEKERAGSYEVRGEEKDANEYAEANLERYPGLVKVVRKGSGRSGFSRFAERS